MVPNPLSEADDVRLSDELGAGGGGGEDGGELVSDGSRYVWTWPEERPTAKRGIVGWIAWVKNSDARGSVQMVSYMASWETSGWERVNAVRLEHLQGLGRSFGALGALEVESWRIGGLTMLGLRHGVLTVHLCAEDIC